LQQLLAPFFSLPLSFSTGSQPDVVIQSLCEMPLFRHADLIQPCVCALTLLAETKRKTSSDLEVRTQTMLAVEKSVTLTASYTLLSAQDRAQQITAARDVFLQAVAESETVLSESSGEPLSRALRCRVQALLLAFASLIGRALVLALDEDPQFFERVKMVCAQTHSDALHLLNALRATATARSSHRDVATITSRRLLHSLLLDASTSEGAGPLMQRCGGSSFIPFVAQLGFVIARLISCWGRQKESDEAVADIMKLGTCLHESLVFSGRCSPGERKTPSAQSQDASASDDPRTETAESGTALVGMLTRAAGAAASMTSRVAGKIAQGVSDYTSCVQHVVVDKSQIVVVVTHGCTAKEMRFFLDACRAGLDEAAAGRPRLLLAAPRLLSTERALDAICSVSE
jgi:hypothetical protein